VRVDRDGVQEQIALRDTGLNRMLKGALDHHSSRNHTACGELRITN